MGRFETRTRLVTLGSLAQSRVVDRDGAEIGRVEELMVDVASGRIAYAVLSFGGFLGVGDRLIAVPYEALTLDLIGERFVLDIPAERLAEVPAFPDDDWPDFTDGAWIGAVERLYGGGNAEREA